MIFTFWEGPMPAYIEMCLETWQDKFPFMVLNYDNLEAYTEYDIESAKRFTLPIQADAVRVHVLRDNGGYWLDADTIMLTDHLPDADILGDIWKGTNTIGYLRSEKNSRMFSEWAKHQDTIIAGEKSEYTPENEWSVLGNTFTDRYIAKNNDVKIGSIQPCWPEVYMAKRVKNWDDTQWMCYQWFYFNTEYPLAGIRKTDMLMLHNSWTPPPYKDLTREQILKNNSLGLSCTLSRIFQEVIKQ